MTNPVTELAYVWAAYAAAILIVGAITLWTLLYERSQRRMIAGLEARGLRRRSAVSPTGPTV